jgi:hypothetical protein
MDLIRLFSGKKHTTLYTLTNLPYGRAGVR